MNFKKIVASVAAVAAAVSMMSVSAFATNWANASYADGNPDTCTIVSTDENKVVFTATGDGEAVKVCVTAGDLLEEADLEKVKSATWTVTYDIPEGSDTSVGGVGGGAWFGKNSTGYWISPEYDENENAFWGNGTYSTEDSVKFLLATETLKADSEIVFQDWSKNLSMASITMTVSDLKFFDADGNEIAQKAYAGAAASTEAAVESTETTDAAATTAPATGNASAAVMLAVMAAAGTAAAVSKKRN